MMKNQTLILCPRRTKENPTALPENWKPQTMSDFQRDRTFENHNHNDSTLQPEPKQNASIMNYPTGIRKQYPWTFFDADNLALKYKDDSQHKT